MMVRVSVFVAALLGVAAGEPVSLANQMAVTTQLCCNQGTSYARNHSAEDCSSSVPPSDVPSSLGSLCIFVMDQCCKEFFPKKRDCDAAVDLAASTNKCDGGNDISKYCCSECLRGRQEAVRGRAACEQGKPGDSTEQLLGHDAFTQCCLNAVNDNRMESKHTEELLTPSSTPFTDLRSLCDDFAPNELCAHHCIPIPGSYKCECNPGFKLMADKRNCIEVVKNRCKPRNPCQHKCIDNGVTVKCSCRRGYHLMDDGKSCEDIDECVAIPSVCLPGTQCHNINGSYKCIPQKKNKDDFEKGQCPPGFARNIKNKACDDINECILPHPPCPSYACENTVGGYKCDGVSGDPLRFANARSQAYERCPIGFRSSLNEECEDVDECAIESDDCNRMSQFCINTRGSFYCQDKASKHCPPGFKINPTTNRCEDINECEDGEDICRSDQVCVNIPGAYDCKMKPKGPQPCQEGFRMHPISNTCEDIDECVEGTHLCDLHQNCLNTNGSHECHCKLGYELDSVTGACKDVNECATDQHNCIPESQRCDNTVGSFICVRFISCGTGYILHHTKSVCEDIDECALGTHNCARAGREYRCVNIPGSFRCVRAQTASSSTTTSTHAPSDYEYYYDSEEEVEGVNVPPPENPLPPPPSPSPSPSTTSSTTTPRPEPPPSVPEPPPTPEIIQDPSPEEPKQEEPRNEVDEPRPTEPPRLEPRVPSEPITEPTNYGRPEEPRPTYYPTAAEPSPPNYNQPAPEEPREPDYYRPVPEEPRQPSYNEPAPEEPRQPNYNEPAPEEPRQPNYYQPTPEEPRQPNYQPNPPPERQPEPPPTERQPEIRPTEPIRPEEPEQPPYNDPRNIYSVQPSPKSEDRYEPSTERIDIETTPEGPKVVLVDVVGKETAVVGEKRIDGSVFVDTKDVPKNQWTVIRKSDEVEKPTDCAAGFERNEYGACFDIDECATNTHSCSGLTEVCHNTMGGYLCNCAEGFRRDLGSGVCDLVSTSTSTTEPPTTPAVTTEKTTSKSYFWGYQDYKPITPRPFRPRNYCDVGFHLNSRTGKCEDINECTNGQANCAAVEICVNTEGGYRCECPPHWQLDAARHRCVPARSPGSFPSGYGNQYAYNPEDPQVVVSPNRDNDNKVVEPELTRLGDRGTVVKCPWGYRLGDDNTCEDIDECATGEANCGPLQLCTNLNGGYSCSCPSGHRLVGDHECEDVDECSAAGSNPICSQHADCVNTIGSYQCRCHEGFRSAPANDKVCVDVDECQEARSGSLCQHRCNNVWGAYRCSCHKGYRINSDNRTCSDVDECTEFKSKGLCIGRCLNEPGSYRCSCPSGYRLAEDKRSCIDIDECESGTAPCAAGGRSGDTSHVCLNTRGSYRCHRIACPPGYKLESKHRCTKIERYCHPADWSCAHQPSTYSYNYITFVSKLYIPAEKVDLFTMRGPTWQFAKMKFQLQLLDVNAPPTVKDKADNSAFLLTQTGNQAVVSLVRSLEGPQTIELELSMELYNYDQFGGIAVAKLFIHVSEYEF